MGDKFDPYREALVVETATVWPQQFAHIGPPQRKQLEKRLHADPQQATELEYVRLYTGFCRKITVTAEDLKRLS